MRRALRELAVRHGRVLAASWRQRHRRPAGWFDPVETEFLPSALSLQERPISPTARWLARILMALAAGALVWSVVGKTEIVVHAAGKVVPVGQSKIIAASDTGRVARVLVADNSRVAAGDVLLRLDAGVTDAEERKWRVQAAQARQDEARSRAMIRALDTGRAPVLAELPADPGMMAAQSYLDSQYADYQAQLRSIEAAIAAYRRELGLVTQIAHAHRGLRRDGDVSQQAYLEKEQARTTLKGRLRQSEAQRAALQTQTRRQAFETLVLARKLAAQAEQEIARTSAQRSRLVLTAPVDGVVQQLVALTEGTAVAATQPLMMVVPSGAGIQVQAQLDSKDIGFVRAGAPASVKVGAYDYTKYGTLEGTVLHVSPDTVVDDRQQHSYRVTIALAQATLEVDGQPQRLKEGMAVQADIRTGSRRLIEYLLSPVARHAGESLGER